MNDDGEAYRQGDETTGICVIECGAGTAIPTVRNESERIAARYGGTLNCINLRDSRVVRGQLAIPLGAADAIARIAGAL